MRSIQDKDLCLLRQGISQSLRIKDPVAVLVNFKGHRLRGTLSNFKMIEVHREHRLKHNHLIAFINQGQNKGAKCPISSARHHDFIHGIYGLASQSGPIKLSDLGGELRLPERAAVLIEFLINCLPHELLQKGRSRIAWSSGSEGHASVFPSYIHHLAPNSNIVMHLRRRVRKLRIASSIASTQARIF